MAKQLSFLASLPNMQSAIKLGGDEGRVTFAVPQSEFENILALALPEAKNRLLRVTVEEAKEEGE